MDEDFLNDGQVIMWRTSPVGSLYPRRARMPSLAFKRDPATRRVLSRQSIAGLLIAPFVRLIYDESRARATPNCAASANKTGRPATSRAVNVQNNETPPRRAALSHLFALQARTRDCRVTHDEFNSRRLRECSCSPSRAVVRMSYHPILTWSFYLIIFFLRL